MKCGLKLSIERIYYPVKVLGPGNRIGIWVLGCDRKCEGCVSPEMQRYDKGKEIEIDDIIKMISFINQKIDGITISGGEPFRNPEALSDLIDKLSNISDDILIFTGFKFEELIQMNNSFINNVLEKCSAIIDGPYIDEMHTPKGLKGSSNQRCIVFKNREKYEDAENYDRELQIIVTDNRMITIGIP